MLNGYDLNTFTETACGRGSTVVMDKGASVDVVMQGERDNESQKSLKGAQSDEESLREVDAMRIMVSKSFIVSEPDR